MLKFTIYLFLHETTRVPLEICSDDTIYQVKQKIEKLHQVKTENHELFLSNTKLENNRKVNDYGISQSDKIRVVPKTRGYIQVFVVLVNPIEIIIEPTATVLELKKLYNEKTGLPIVHQRLIFGCKQLEDEKNLSEYNIKHKSTIYLVTRLSGGGGFITNFFQDLTEPTTTRPWNNNAPSWRVATGGLNLEGDCKNNSCEAYEQRVIIQWGYRDFDFFQDEHKSRCPLCNKYITTVTCGFSNTFWKCVGTKKVDGEPPEKVNTDWEFAPSGGYTTFRRESKVIWRDLVIKVKKEL